MVRSNAESTYATKRFGWGGTGSTDIRRTGRIITVGLRLYRAALNELAAAGSPGDRPLAHNKGGNSYLPFRLRQGAMERSREMKTLLKFSSQKQHRERRPAKSAFWRICDMGSDRPNQAN